MSDTNTPPDLDTDALLKEKDDLTRKLEGFRKELELAQKQSVEASEIMSSLAKNPAFSQELLTQSLHEEAQLKQKMQEAMNDQYPSAFQKAFEQDPSLHLPEREAAFKRDFEKQFEDQFRLQAMREEGQRLDSITLSQQTNVGPRLPLTGQSIAQFKTQIAAAHEQHEFWGNQAKTLHNEAQKTQRDLLALEEKISAQQQKAQQTVETPPQKPTLNENEVAELKKKLEEMERRLAIDKESFEKLSPQAAANEDLFHQVMPKKPGPYGNVSYTEEMKKMETTIANLEMGIRMSQAELAQGFNEKTAARVEQMEKLSKGLGSEIHWASRELAEWGRGHSVEERIGHHIEGESHEIGRWKSDMTKVIQKEQDLLARRAKLSSNFFTKLWNRNEISKIDNELKDSIPKHKAGLMKALDESEKDLNTAQAALAKLAEMRKQQDLQQGLGQGQNQDQQLNLNQHQKQTLDGSKVKDLQEVSLPNSGPLSIHELASMNKKTSVGETLHKSLHGHGDHGSGAQEVGVPQHGQGQGVHVKN